MPDTSYRLANYMIRDKNGEIHKYENEPFAAVPVIVTFQPDIMFVLGTTGSLWDQFCGRLSPYDVDQNDLRQLSLLSEKADDETDPDKLQNQITEIFNRTIDTQKRLHMDKKVVTVPVVLKAGVTEAEMNENYSRLSQVLNKYLNRNGGYEAAFDITHSYRSLPVYTLAALNYQKVLTWKDMDITHVYYGMFEAKNQYEGYAPVVDLGGLMKMIQLTEGVNEFKHTGSCQTIIASLPEEETDLKKSLSAFELAEQTNNIDMMASSLEELYHAIDTSSEEYQLQDLKMLIRDVLRREVLRKFEPEKLPLVQTDPYVYADFQLAVSRWYFRKKNYGQAVLNLTETIRSYAMIALLIENNKPVTIQNVVNEEYRRDVFWKYIYNSKLDFYNRCKDLLHDLNDVRNVYAHNLNATSKALKIIENADELIKLEKSGFDIAASLHNWSLQVRQTDSDSE